MPISSASFDEIRAQLGYESENPRIFEWYCFFESEVIDNKSNLPFAPEKAHRGSYGRRVILTGEVRGANACGFPSTTAEQYQKKVIAISPHSHDGKQKCRMQEKGSVLINVPVSMAVSDLNEFSCTEPENTELYSYIKRLYI